MINRVVLVGRLTRDPDLRFTSGGAAVATFSLAVNRQFTNQAGEREADFINCVIWRKPAENLSNFVRKGSLLAVEGRLQTRNYENQQGQRVYVTEVVIDNFSLLESKSASEQRQQHQGGSASSFNGQGGQTHNSFTPNNSSSNTNPTSAPDPFASEGQTIDISDDDLPF